MGNETQGGFLVSQVHQLSARVFERMLRDAGLGHLTAARGRIVFVLLQEDGIAQNELAARVKLDKSGLALTLKELETEGLIRRSRSAVDRRVSLVHRTEAFEALRERFDQVSRKMTLEFYQGLTEDEVAGFEGVLKHILENLERCLEPGS